MVITWFLNKFLTHQMKVIKNSIRKKNVHITNPRRVVVIISGPNTF